MAQIVSKSKLAEGISLLLLKTPEMSRKTRPGQYVFIKRDEHSPPVPLLVAEKDKKGISVIVDTNTPPGEILGDLKKGQEVTSVLGPLGKPVRVGDFGNVCIVADAIGVGAAMIISQALRRHENKVYLIASFASKKQRFWDSRIKQASDKFLIATNKQDSVVNAGVSELRDLLRRKHISLVIGATQLQTLPEIAKATEMRSHAITLLLPPIGDDGIGLSSMCKFTYDNESRLACVEGPAVNGHKVDWPMLTCRRTW